MNIQDKLKGLNEEEKKYVLSVLTSMNNGDSRSYTDLMYEDYDEIPVDIETFVTDDNYMGQAWKDSEGNLKLYPYWMDKLKELFPDNVSVSVNNFIESGARGLGKSEVASLTGMYLMYRVLCMKNPLEFYHMKPTEKICFAFMNITKELSEDIGVNKFQKSIQKSPWFMAKGRMTTRSGEPYWIPPEPISIIIGSQSSHVIGQPIFWAFFDEISFIRNQDIDRQKQIAINMIDTAIGGMKTRFIHKGKNPTLLILASSKRSEKSFLEEHMKKKLASEKENVLIVDEPVWLVKPKGTYSEKTFHVAVGNKYLMSKIIANDEDTKLYWKQGYKILDVPIDFKADFMDDIERALCDFAGVSSSELSKYISGQAVNDCISDKRKNPFTKEILEIGNAPDDRLQYYNFFDINAIPPEWRSKPLYIHLDMSISGDKTGIAGIFAIGKKISKDPKDQSKDMFYGLGFSVSIKAPKGRQISFEKNRKLIYWLREQGFKIQGVSTDSFQSYDLGQQLSALGYNYKQISVDRVENRVCKPYQYFKSTLYEKRIDLYPCKLLTDELTDLERNINTGKVDHPNGGCFTEDTKIALVDGRTISIKDLLLEQQYKTNFVYSFNEKEKIIEPKPILSVHQTKITKNLVKVTLDNGEVITCTPEHRFMLRDGGYEEIQNLLPGDSLMPLYTKVSDNGLSGYRMYYEPIENEWHYEHRRFCVNATLKRGSVIHHCNYDKLDNSPTNLKEMLISEHSTIHNNETHDYTKTSEGLKRYFRSIKGTQKEVERNRNCKEGAINSYKRRGIYRGDIIENHRKEIEELSGKPYDELTISERDGFGVKLSRIKDPTILDRISSTLSERHREGRFANAYRSMSRLVWYTNGVDNVYIDKDLDPPEGYYRGRSIDKETREKMSFAQQNKSQEEKDRLRKIYSENTSSRIWITDGIVDKYINKNSAIPEGFHRGRCKVGKNHKIVSIERITKPCKVYDLTIKDNHNFALAAGVFVHNSKDMADAVCGALFFASQNAEQFAYDYGEAFEVMENVTLSTTNEEERKKQITIDFQNELARMMGPPKPKKQSSLYKDFGMGPSKPATSPDIIFI